MSVILQSSDKQDFSVSLKAAQQSNLVKDMIDARENAKSPIVLEEVTGEVLAKIIEYCEHHQNDSLVDNGKDDIFMEVDTDMLCKILLAAKNMDIKPLVDMGCKTTANLIRGKSQEEIRTMFNITSSCTDAECCEAHGEDELTETPKQD
ncbi:hypothetical protein GGH96_002786 [Coemansia sp. RSA 1972]|nr:hypothetical protein GGH96_002786 [Coemansia sp. RSA 1972]